jgi:peptide deformylase
VAIQDILQLGNPILWQKSSPITDIKASQTKVLIKDLKDTLANFRNVKGFGRAIAAPQIGILKQMIFVNTSEFAGPLINPVITWASDEKFELWDDCFSFPDLMVRVSRSIKIKVDYQDKENIKNTLIVEKDLAELLQHEIDHLNGVLALDRAISAKAFSTRNEWLRQKSDT